MSSDFSEWSPWLTVAAQQTPNVSCLLNEAGQMVYMNPAAENLLMGEGVEQVAWHRTLDWIHEGEQTRLDDRIRHVELLQFAEDHGAWEGFLAIKRRGSRELLIAVAITALRDTEGKVSRYHLSGHEVTQVAAGQGLHIDDQRFALMTELIDDVISLHDSHLVTLYATSAITRLTGMSPRQIIGKSTFRRVHPEDRRTILNAQRHLRRQGEVTLRWRHVTRKGQWRWFETKARVLDESWLPARYLCSTRDVSERMESEEHILWRSRHDILTELPNRSYFLERVQLATQQVTPERMVAVLFVDLDGFKRINDSLGHATGDALLRVIAQRLMDAVRSDDVVGRMGGDEFTILLDPIHSAEETEILVRRLLAAIARPVTIGGQDLFVSGSVGVSFFPDDGADAETLVRHADVAMYQAKKLGNSFRYFDLSMHDAAQERLRQERVLRRALELGELEMHYQPQVSPVTGVVEGMEALLRWRRPEGELPISPARFVAVAEESGLIEPLGAWILQDVCEQAASWLTETGICPPVAVNVSTHQLTQTWFLRRVEQTLQSTGLPPHLLEVEITESAFLGKGDVARKTLEGLRALGVRLAVDDFGTGYSSLSYLRDLPLDCLKIDAAFLVDLQSGRQTQSIVRAIIELSHALNLTVVAEGVEDEDQRTILAELGCDRIQGYLISPAVPATAVPKLLKSLQKTKLRFAA